MQKIIDVELPKSDRTLKQQLQSAQRTLSTCRYHIRNAMYHWENGKLQHIEYNGWKRNDYEHMEQYYIDVIRAKMRIELIKNEMGNQNEHRENHK